MDSRKLKEQQEQRELYEAVLLIALRITHSPVTAQDMTHEAFARLHARPWDPTKAPSLVLHLAGIVRSIHSTEQRSRRRESERHERIEGDRAALSGAGRPAAAALESLEREADQATATRRVEQLRARLEKRGLTLELEICDHLADANTKRSDLKRLTGKSPDEIKAAMACIRRYANSVMTAERGEDEEDEQVHS